MRFTIALSALVTFVLTTAVNAAGPTPLDVFVPPITSPTAGTVWVSKTQQNVTWDASRAPPTISNQAMVLLRKGDTTFPFILAKGFDLRKGSVEITVPYVFADNYQVVLFGDSGNFSPVFAIQSDTPA
ncbi:hypothetical protein B0H13DRAFT_2261979 [Mycena leptocephala]|nr:hypothetical protein B0H13DRAFT_2261979 [Mycena leptocephala]